MAAEATGEKPEAEEPLLDYEEDEDEAVDKPEEAAAAGAQKGHYVGVHSSGFRDFLLKPELLRAIVDCGFEHPSEVQSEAIPQALLGGDVLCQAKSGMGKTAVFVLTTLNQMVAKEGECSVFVLSHTRELAYQIGKEFTRLSKYLPGMTVGVLYGGVPRSQHVKMLKESTPHVVVSTPGRALDLLESGDLKVDKVRFFVLDECDKMLDSLDMRRDVQKIFIKTPHDKQVMMYSATLSPEVRATCKLFMHEPLEITIDESKLTLHGLQQYFCKLSAEEKNRKLVDLLDSLEFNQVVIFVSSASRARELDRLLKESNFPSIHIHGRMKQVDRIAKYNAFRSNDARVLVSTNLFGRGIDIERVNVVINYDFPATDDKSGEAASDQYLHRVGRAGRFGTKGLAISFVGTDADEEALKEVQSRFEVEIPTLPDEIDSSTYMG